MEEIKLLETTIRATRLHIEHLKLGNIKNQSLSQKPSKISYPRVEAIARIVRKIYDYSDPELKVASSTSMRPVVTGGSIKKILELFTIFGAAGISFL